MLQPSQPTQPSQPSISVSPAPKAPTPMLFSRFFSDLRALYSQGNLPDIARLIKGDANNSCFKQLSSALLNFPVKRMGEHNTLSKAKASLWGKQHKVSEIELQKLIVTMSEQLDLDELTVFNLIDAYFSKETQNIFSVMVSLQGRAMAIKQRISNQVQGLQGQYQFQYNNKEKDQSDLKTINVELDNVFKQVRKGTLFHFISERKALLDSIYLLFQISQKTDDFKPNLKDLLIAKLIVNLIKSIEANKSLADNQLQFCEHQRDLILAIQNEEILIYKILFSYLNLPNFPEKDDLVAFFKYQNTTNFKGCLSSKLQAFHTLSHDHLTSQNQSIIEQLTILLSLNFIKINAYCKESLNQQAKDFSLLLQNQQIKDLIAKDLPLNAKTALLLLAYAEIHNKSSPQKIKPDQNKVGAFMDYLISIENGMIFQNLVLADQKHIFQLLINHFINLVYPFLSANQMREEIHQAKQMMLNIIKDSESLKEIWDRKEAEKGLKIPIFQDEIDNPQHDKAIFYQIMLALCGNKHHAYGFKVYTFLKQTPLDMDGSLLEAIVGDTLQNVIRLSSTQLDLHGVQSLSSSIVLLCTFIRQNPFFYEEINRIMVEIASGLENVNEKVKRGEMSVSDIQKQEPFLNLLFRAFQAFIRTDPELSLRPCKHILNALSKIYANFNLQKEIILIFKVFKGETGFSLLSEFINFISLQYESPSQCLRVTASYLKLLIRIFEKEFPQSCLDEHSKIELDLSFLGESLTVIYQILMSQYLNLHFHSSGEFSKFSSRLVKLTSVLLSKFLDMPHYQRAQVCQMSPMFNFLFEIIVTTLNQSNVENILLSILELSEQRGEDQDMITLQTGEKLINNKLWIAIIEGGVDINKSRKGFQKLIVNTLRCLTILTELAFQNVSLMKVSSQDKQAGLSLQAGYLSKLNCVQNMTKILTDPLNLPYIVMKKSQSFTDLQFSLCNTVSYYLKPELSLCNTISHVQISAIKFFTSACKVWELQSEPSRSQLYLQLQHSQCCSGSQAISKFASSFELSCKLLPSPNSLQLISAMFDLLIITCSSQHSFAEHLLKDRSFQDSFSAIMLKLKGKELEEKAYTPQEKIYIREAFCKGVIVLASMSVSRVCIDFMRSLLQRDILRHLHENFLNDYLLNYLTEKPKIGLFDTEDATMDPEQIESRIAQNNGMTKHHFEICQASAAFYYYLKLLQSEYTQDPDSKNLKLAIAELFKNLSVITHSDQFDLSQFYSEAIQFNHELQTNTSLRSNNIDLIQYISQKGLLGDFRDADKINNKLITQSGSVYLQNLDCHEAYAYLQTVPPYKLISIEPFNYKQMGKCSINFIIPTNNLSYLLKYFQYSDANLVSKAVASFQNYNLAIAISHFQYLLSQAKMDFILQIGKIKMKENIRLKVEDELIVASSLYNLVGMIEPKPSDSGQVKAYQTKMVDLMLQFVNGFEKKVFKVKPIQYDEALKQARINKYQMKQFESDLDFLTLVLGVINSQASLPFPLPQNNFVALENIVQKEIIPKLPAILDQEIGYICIQHKAANRCLNLDSDTLTARMFTQIVQQVFQLCISLQSQDKDKRLASSHENMLSSKSALHTSELQYIQILQHICTLMDSGYCFLSCLSIIQQALQLLSPNATKTFMEAKSMFPLRVIVQKFIQPDVSEEESMRIIKFFVNYAGSVQGATHLIQEDILHNVSMNQCVQRVNREDLYVKDVNGDIKRNQAHLVWCQALILIRTLNDQLIENNEYVRALVKAIKIYEFRLSQVLELGQLIMEEEKHVRGVVSHNQTVLGYQNANRTTLVMSLALFEEIELITSAFFGLFIVAEKWAQINPSQYNGVKELYMTSVVHLFSKDRIKFGFGTTPSSSTEQYLSSISMDQGQHDRDLSSRSTGLVKWFDDDFKDSSFNMNGFELRIELCKLRTCLNVNLSLLQVCALNKQLKPGKELLSYPMMTSLLSATGKDVSHSSISFQKIQNSVQDRESDEALYVSTLNLLSSLEYMHLINKALVRQEQKMGVLARRVDNVMHFDDWVVNEYMGLNDFIILADFRRILEEYDMVCQIGLQVCAFMTEKVIRVHERNCQELVQEVKEFQVVGLCESLKKMQGMMIVMEDNWYSNRVKGRSSTVYDQIGRFLKVVEENKY